MSRPQCRYEADVAAGIRTDSLADHLRRHAESCPDCRETLLVASFMANAAAATAAPALPHPGLLLLKARQQRRMLEQRSATRAITWAARLAPAALTVAAGAIWWWKADALTALGAPLGPLPATTVVALLLVMTAALWALVQVSLYRLVED